MVIPTPAAAATAAAAAGRGPRVLPSAADQQATAGQGRCFSLQAHPVCFARQQCIISLMHARTCSWEAVVCVFLSCATCEYAHLTSCACSSMASWQLAASDGQLKRLGFVLTYADYYFSWVRHL